MTFSEYINDITTYFRNKVLNSAGAERDFLQLIEDRDIGSALELMQNRDDDVDNAIKEYNPQTHKVTKRPNKYRDGKNPYITVKLPRSRQRYINEVELFFLLGRPIVWKRKEGEDEAFKLFTDFLDEHHFNSTLRKCKRLAGAETESAKVYYIYNEDNEAKVKEVVCARSEGYKLRPLFDKYKNLRAFACGYKEKRGGTNVECWDIQTKDFVFFCRKRPIGWEVETYENPTGKINVIYYQQRKAWEGVEMRIEREEELDSKVGDTNNYFADPIATATADVIQSMVDPDRPGKLIQLMGTNSRFEYVNPPQSSDLRNSEKADLERSILFDTFTPDMSYDSLRGMGSLSGAAIRNALILGFMKADNYKETYEELVTREKNLIIAILKYLHPDKTKMLDELVVEFEFSSPFDDDKQSFWRAVCDIFKSGLLSLERAVELLALTDAPEEEIERIKALQAEQMAAETGDNGVDINDPANAEQMNVTEGAETENNEPAPEEGEDVNK